MFKFNFYGEILHPMEPDIVRSNTCISDFLRSGKPFTVVRLGQGPETFMTHAFLQTGKINLRYLDQRFFSLPNAGIYSRERKIEPFAAYARSYAGALERADALACFQEPNMQPVQEFFSRSHSLERIHSRSLEPFYAIMEGERPWTLDLLGKKVLVINPFVESFKSQLCSGFKMFNDPEKRLFEDGQEFLFYKSYQTIAGNHIHMDWMETMRIMCADVSKLDFDVALLGCGGYGLPMCDFIKTRLGKSAIYIGGGLQLMFGVMGRRWEGNQLWREIISKEKSKFVRPSASEACLNSQIVEGGCYW
jgi:hypothetical protein